MRAKKRFLKINNLIILYNIITIVKYIIINQNILYNDFMIDFVFLNISIFIILKSYNLTIKYS